MSGFQRPIFDSGCLELFYDSNEICIYGTRKGLSRLAQIIAQLAERDIKKGSEHIHLEDYELLTSDSLRAVIAVFDDIGQAK